MLVHTALLACLLLLGGAPASDLSDKALSILEQNCGNDSCHGGPDAYRFDVRRPETLVDAQVIKPGRSSDSELIHRVEAGIMPLGGYRGQPGAKLPSNDIQVL